MQIRRIFGRERRGYRFATKFWLPCILKYTFSIYIPVFSQAKNSWRYTCTFEKHSIIPTSHKSTT